MRYDKACSSLQAAKEMIAITENKIKGLSGSFDPTWQEMLNHADVRVGRMIYFLILQRKINAFCDFSIYAFTVPNILSQLSLPNMEEQSQLQD